MGKFSFSQSNECIRTDTSGLFIAGEQQPRFFLGCMVRFHQREYAASVISSYTLRGHQNISILRFANFFYTYLMNGIKMRNQHNGCFPWNKNIIAFTGNCGCLIHSAKFREKHFLWQH